MGELNIHAVDDLGALGAREGPPVTYHWVPTGMLHHFLPWALILCLLLFKPNRCGQVWWILAPLVVVLLGINLLRGLDLVPSEPSEILSGAVTALGFGLAAVWLLAPFLVRSNRFFTLLCIVPALGVSSTVALALGLDWGDGAFTAAQGFIMIPFGVLAVSLALFVAGWICRGRYRPVALSLWLFLVQLVSWLAILAPIGLIAALASGSSPPWAEFGLAILVIAGICFGVTLPFLLLSFANRCFGQRLRGLLHIQDPAPPTIAPPLAEPSVAMAET